MALSTPVSISLSTPISVMLGDIIGQPPLTVIPPAANTAVVSKLMMYYFSSQIALKLSYKPIVTPFALSFIGKSINTLKKYNSVVSPFSLSFLGKNATLTKGSSQQAETTTLLAQMAVQPTTAQVTTIDTLIASLKSAGVWDKLDRLFMLNLHTSQASLLDWRNPTNTGTAVNSPTFTAYSGFTGNGSSSYVQLFAPNSKTLFSALMSSHYGVGCTHPTSVPYGTTTSGYVVGSAAGNCDVAITPRTSDNYPNCLQAQILSASNCALTSGQVFPTNSGTSGNYVVNSPTVGAASVQTPYINGSPFGGTYNANTTRATYIATVVTLLRYDVTYSNRLVKYFHLGAGLTDTEIANLNTAITTFQTNMVA